MHCEEVSVFHGQTEASSVITMHSQADWEQRSSTVVGADGATVAPGEVGELRARGYHMGGVAVVGLPDLKLSQVIAA